MHEIIADAPVVQADASYITARCESEMLLFCHVRDGLAASRRTRF